MATLLLSQGVPMICGGDELSHTQGGNNNAYCQDNVISWLAWDLDNEEKEFLEFVRNLVHFRREQPVLNRRKFFQGRPIRGSEIKDISWLNTSGHEMTDEQWNAGWIQCIGVRLAGDIIGDVDEQGKPLFGDTILVLINASPNATIFQVPPHKKGQKWMFVLDTAIGEAPKQTEFREGDTYLLQDRSLAVLRIRSQEAEE
jgi:glycogen operon protein